MIVPKRFSDGPLFAGKNRIEIHNMSYQNNTQMLMYDYITVHNEPAY